MIRVMVVDDQALVRGALSALLELEDDIEVVAQVGAGHEVVAAAHAHRPDVCLMDIQLPGIDGIAATALLRREVPSVHVLVVTTFDRPGYLRRALEAGAVGYLVKDAPADELAEAVRKVAAGLRVVDPSLAQQSLFDGANPLTEREVQVLRLAADGLSVARIAEQVFLTPGSVRNVLSSAIGKTGTENRVEAARVALRRGWV